MILKRNIVRLTKLLTTDDYEYITFDGEAAKNIYPVVDKKKENIEFSYYDPNVKHSDPGWEDIYLYGLIFRDKRGREDFVQWRFAKESVLDKLDTKNVWLKYQIEIEEQKAKGLKGYKSMVSKDTLGTFGDFMKEL